MQNTKAALRKEFIARRKQLSANQCTFFLSEMLENFHAISFPEICICMSYSAIIEQNEVPPVSFENRINEMVNDYSWCMPKMIDSDGNMQAIMVDGNTLWDKNAWGIKEPKNGKVVNSEEIGLILVPLLAFDRQGYRVGYGKGYYDRFLKHCQSEVLTIGLSWFDPVEAIADINSNDVSLKYCVTPQQLYAF